MSSATVIAGMHVRSFSSPAQKPLARPVELAMLRLATGFLSRPVFAATRATDDSLGFIEPWNLQGTHFYAEEEPSGLRRLQRLPKTRALLERAVASAGYAYARLPSPVGFQLCAVARRQGVPYWVSVHGDATDVWHSAAASAASRGVQFYSHARRHLADAQLRTALKHARAAFFVGEPLQSACGHLLNGPSLSFANYLHNSKDVAADARRRQPDRTPNILYVGALTSRKGVQDLLDAHAAVTVLAERRPTLTVVGDGEQRTTLSDQPGVRWTGWLSSGDLDEEFSKADILVLPSRSGEGVPKVVIEAMARGIPVIATSVGGTTALLSNDRGWLVPPGQPSALVQALLHCLRDEALARRRANAALSYVRENDFENTQRRLRAVIEQVAPGTLS